MPLATGAATNAPDVTSQAALQAVLDDRAGWDADALRVLKSFTPQSTFSDIVKAMHRYHVHHIYVVGAEGHPIGVVSNRDVIREILNII